MKDLKISVITINYNNCTGLEQTLQSVAAQNCSNFEHIVIDGGSTDGSKDLITSYSDKISYWVSEPDKGAYNAMNKGALAANGEYCMFVNSGDQLHSSKTISEIIAKEPSTDIVMGMVENMSASGSSRLWHPCEEDKISLVYLRDNPIHHPGALIRTSLQKKIPYNESLRICSDRQFFIEALILNNCSYSTIPVVMNRFAPQGLSGIQNDNKMIEEDLIYLNELFPPRLIRDIFATNDRIQQTTRRMASYYTLTNKILKMNESILNVADVFLSLKKHFRNR